MIYGDTNTTLAGAARRRQAARSVAHVEAGLRSFNRAMPEEQQPRGGRSSFEFLFCPTDTAVRNLAAEGISAGVHLVGDVMAEAHADAVARARSESTILERLQLGDRGYVLATVHRAENTNDVARLRNILNAFNALGERVVFPMHPRTRLAAEQTGWTPSANVLVVEPQGYLDMVRLEASARVVLTDSGGVQKEAYWLGVPCVTMRDETEWVETLEGGRNVLAGSDPAKIVACARAAAPVTSPVAGQGGDSPAHRIAAVITERPWI